MLFLLDVFNYSLCAGYLQFKCYLKNASTLVLM